jgi:hypothetical protein
LFFLMKKKERWRGEREARVAGPLVKWVGSLPNQSAGHSSQTQYTHPRRRRRRRWTSPLFFCFCLFFFFLPCVPEKPFRIYKK